MPIRSTTYSQLKRDIENLQNELEFAEKDDQYHEMAADIRLVYDSFVDVGFTEDQAWEIVRTIINNGTMPKHS